MAINTMRIKARDNVQVYDGRMTERPESCGYSRAEARGIFGSRKLEEKGGVVVDAEAYERKKKQIVARTRKGKPRRKPGKHADLPHVVTAEEAERIEEHNRRKAEAELRRCKSIHSGVVDRMRKRQEAAMAKVMAMEPR